MGESKMSDLSTKCCEPSILGAELGECLTTLAKLREQGASARAIRKVAASVSNHSVRTTGTPGARFYVEAAKAFAQLEAPKPSELERAEKVIVKAARLLEQIVAGNIRDNGTDYDKLAAASIRRHLPGIVGSAVRLGIDVRKVDDFFQGRHDEPEKVCTCLECRCGSSSGGGCRCK